MPDLLVTATFVSLRRRFEACRRVGDCRKCWGGKVNPSRTAKWAKPANVIIPLRLHLACGHPVPFLNGV